MELNDLFFDIKWAAAFEAVSRCEMHEDDRNKLTQFLTVFYTNKVDVEVVVEAVSKIIGDINLDSGKIADNIINFSKFKKEKGD